MTEADLNYEGSLTLDKNLMEAAGLLPYEKVQVVSVTNGVRAETYLIEGDADSGQVCINGALAHLIGVGDMIIIMAYALVDESELAEFQPNIVLVDENNRIKQE